MSKKVIFEFLEALSKNNSKEWMDANRKWYEEAKSEVVDLFEPILKELKEFDPRIVQPTARKAISRINNNLMFHPERPTYKNHFGLVFSHGKGTADFYVHLGIDETLVAGGLWHPDSEKLKKVRTEIDYEGGKLQAIVDAEPFKSWFQVFQGDIVKTAPKGYSRDHEHIHLLRLKSFAAIRPITRQDILGKDFQTLVIDSYRAISPMIDFINVALTDN
jgi:uncharacterized protein (TIGR02453 family)